jgi:predicted HTH domain antitoxin
MNSAWPGGFFLGKIFSGRKSKSVKRKTHARHAALPLSRLAEFPVQVHALVMQLTLPETVETTLSPRKAALHLAIGLFVSEEATLGQAAEIAGQTQAAFLKELGARHLSIHYGLDELAEDLKVVESFRR